MDQKGTGREYPFKGPCSVADKLRRYEAGKERVSRMTTKDSILARRRFLGAAVGALATSQFLPGQRASAGLAFEKPIEVAQSEAPGSLTSLKQIQAGVLSVGYVEAGPVNGPAVVLLHG